VRRLQSVRLHVLGQKALESQEEDSVAVGNVGWSAGRNQPHCSRCSACHHYRRSNLGRPKGQSPAFLSQFWWFNFALLTNQHISYLVQQFGAHTQRVVKRAALFVQFLCFNYL